MPGSPPATGSPRTLRPSPAALLDRVTSRTGRGVTIDINASGLLPARNAVAHIGLVGSHTYDVVIFAPCAAIQQHLLDTGSPSLRVLMLGIPQPGRATPLDAAAAAAATTTNRALRNTASGSVRVHYLRPADFTSVHDPHPFTAAYYRTVGHQIAEFLLPTIDQPRPR